MPVAAAVSTVPRHKAQTKVRVAVKAWTWFETKMYGRALPRLPRGQRLKLLGISALLGVVLGVTLFVSGLSQSFLAAGLKSAGYDPRPLYQNYATPTATPPPAATPPTTTLPLRGGGWVTPTAP
jgi:hypothetical protein